MKFEIEIDPVYIKTLFNLKSEEAEKFLKERKNEISIALQGSIYRIIYSLEELVDDYILENSPQQ